MIDSSSHEQLCYYSSFSFRSSWHPWSYYTATLNLFNESGRGQKFKKNSFYWSHMRKFLFYTLFYCLLFIILDLFYHNQVRLQTHRVSHNCRQAPWALGFVTVLKGISAVPGSCPGTSPDSSTLLQFLVCIWAFFVLIRLLLNLCRSLPCWLVMMNPLQFQNYFK